MKPFSFTPIRPEVRDMEQETVNVVLGLDGIQLDEVRWRAVGRDPENLKVDLADDWFADEPAVESVE